MSAYTLAGSAITGGLEVARHQSPASPFPEPSASTVPPHWTTVAQPLCACARPPLLALSQAAVTHTARLRNGRRALSLWCFLSRSLSLSIFVTQLWRMWWDGEGVGGAIKSPSSSQGTRALRAPIRWYGATCVSRVCKHTRNLAE